MMRGPQDSTFRSAAGPRRSLPSESARSKWVPSAQVIRISLIALLVTSQPITPAIIPVGGGCSLVDAITAANSDVATGSCLKGAGADVIQLTADVTLTAVNNTTPDTSPTLAHGPNGLPVVTSEIVIDGKDHTIARGAGSPVFRIFSVGLPGDLTLQNTTLSNGGGAAFANGGGAIANGFGGIVSLSNSTLSGNSAGGGNLADDTTCGSIPGTLSGLDPSLADNGGPTLTHQLVAGSNAIGIAGTCGLAADQRGALRSDGACDSGAFEFVPCPDLNLHDDSVTGVETQENCQNIVVGPSFFVLGTGNLTLRAGRTVILSNEVSVDPGGQLTIEIDADLQLTLP